MNVTEQHLKDFRVMASILLDRAETLLLRRKPDDDESAVRQSLERRILHLAETE